MIFKSHNRFSTFLIGRPIQDFYQLIFALPEIEQEQDWVGKTKEKIFEEEEVRPIISNPKSRPNKIKN